MKSKKDLEKIITSKGGISTMKVFYKKDFIIEDDKVIISNLGDMHYGHKCFKRKEFEEVLKSIYDNKNTYVVGMGDYLEAATRDSVGGGVFEQEQFVQEQLETVCEYLKPLADAGKILGLLRGNHEERIYKHSGLDVTKIMAKILNTKYFGSGIMMRLKVGFNNYTIYATHGSSGASMPHTKIRACINLAQIYDADIYCMGHLHELDHKTMPYYTLDTKNKTLVQKDRHFILTGSYLDYLDSYAESKNMFPAKSGSPKIKLSAKEKRIRVSI